MSKIHFKFGFFVVFCFIFCFIFFCFYFVCSFFDRPSNNIYNTFQITRPSPTMNGTPIWRTTKLVILLVVVFALLWFPVHFLVLWTALDEQFPKTFTIYLIKGIAKALSYSNSCINPFLYVFMSKGFRQALKRAFPNVIKILFRRVRRWPPKDNKYHSVTDHPSEYMEPLVLTLSSFFKILCEH